MTIMELGDVAYQANRARLVVRDLGAFKCDLQDARRHAELAPHACRVEVSTVWLMEDGAELLGPWKPDIEPWGSFA